MPTAPEDDIPESHKVVCEDDLVGKNARIVYHENLKTLATYLQLPIQREWVSLVTSLIRYMCYTIIWKEHPPAPFASYVRLLCKVCNNLSNCNYLEFVVFI